MKVLLTILSIFIIIEFSVFADPFKYNWETPKSVIEKDHKLSTIQIETFNHNFSKLLGETESTKFSFYILDDAKKTKYCEYDLSTILVF